ncbi:PAS domain-containing sensor histidine kinase [Duganella sp. HH105]|uniref:PAS domain-containing sensor histidine kinase n=1 Tax=Duganella sp. HH105 TaxID=1781067 RepID=UPI000877C0F7|nr:PAS domain S-box protein [Duganella sp. HH105]OEZ57644.1 cell-division control histidine kinase PdhS [Duganella sp. HH105]
MATDFGTLILNETPDAVVLTSLDGEVVCWSNGAQAVFGYSSEEALGRRLAELIVPSGMAEQENAVLLQTLQDGAANYESMRHAKDGSLVYIDSSSKLVHDDDGRPVYILWSKKDVTALKVLRDAKLVEARFDGLLESLPDAIIMANASGRIVLANTQAEALFGYPRGALRGIPLEQLMPPRFRARHVQHRSGFQHQPVVRPMGGGRELYGLRSDGMEFPVEISLSPIETLEGTLVMSAIRDTSERKRIERSLQEKNAELARASAAKDRFLTGMSHELRTPLNAIIGFTGTMLMKLPGPINGEQEKQLRTVQSSARHLLSMINDMLDLTRIETGKLELDLMPLQCRQLIDEVLLLFKPQARHKGLELEFVSAPQDLTVVADRRALQQILMNLLHNAIKFTDHGKVMVQLDTGTVSDRSCVTISVSDTGSGIDEEEQGTLFQAFSQLEAGKMRQDEGTGLGLHLSQRLAEMLRGEILFDSESGVGSVFTLALPLER